MIHFVLESDRDVLVNGIGLLPAGEPVEVSEVSARYFEAIYNTSLAKANFAPYVKVTAVPDGGE